MLTDSQALVRFFGHQLGVGVLATVDGFLQVTGLMPNAWLGAGYSLASLVGLTTVALELRRIRQANPQEDSA